MTEIKIKPMSINQAWRGGRRFKTNEYKAYEEQMCYMLPARYSIPEGNLTLTIEVGFSNRGSDLDNVCKPFIDILQKKYGFNDNRIYEIHLCKKIVKKGEDYISFEIT